MKAKDILLTKGPDVYTIIGDKTLNDALKSLVKNNIGVLPVINDMGRLDGIISERDILRAIQQTGIDCLSKKVSDYMTRNIIFADFDDNINYIESVMTSNKIRHIPILKDMALIGLISIGDIVKATLSDKDFENKYLLDYIHGVVN